MILAALYFPLLSIPIASECLGVSTAFLDNNMNRFGALYLVVPTLSFNKIMPAANKGDDAEK